MSESWKQFAQIPVEMEIFINHASGDHAENLMLDLFQEETGVKLTFIGAGTTGNEKLNLLIATNEMPDLFWSNVTPEIRAMAAENRLWSIEELSARYAPDVMSRIHTNQRVRTRMAFESQTIYGAPGFGWIGSDQLDNPIVPKNVDASMLRQDIYEALGSPDISTPDKLQDVLRQVKAAYPGVIPFQSGFRYWNGGWSIPGPVTLLKPHFGLTTVDWIEGPAGYHNFIEDPRFVRLLEWMSRNYNEGLMSPTELTDQHPIPRQNIDKGQVFFIGINMAGRAFAHNDGLRAAGVNGEFDVVKPFTLAGEMFVSDTFSGGTTASHTYISRTTRYPERAISMIDWLMSDHGQAVNNFGPDLTQWEFLADGYPAWSRAGVESELASKIMSHPRQPQLRINYFQFWKGQVSAYYVNRLPGGQWTERQTVQNRWNAISNAYYQDLFRFSLIPGLGGDTEEGKTQATLNEYIGPEVVRIIMGRPGNVASAYAAMMVRARELGFDRIKAWYNDQARSVEQRVKQYSN